MTSSFFDTHAHLDDSRFAEDIAIVVDRAKAAGLIRVITIGVDRLTSQANLQLAEKFPLLKAAVGIQPNHVAEAVSGDWEAIVEFAKHPLCVAIGETGLDRYWDRTPFAMQEDYFARHLELAHKSNKPVIIHCREAEADTVRMLRDQYVKTGPIKGIMHSYTGDASNIQQCLQMGLHVSFAGMLTYKNAQNVRDVAAMIPMDRLLIETDSPYLAPVPHRGKRNEPSFVVHTAECLAQVKQVTVEQIATITTKNACDLFGF